MEKIEIGKHVFTVIGKEYLTPHYIRIKLKPLEQTAFAQCTPGANNKIFIPPAGTQEVRFSTFDVDLGVWVMPDEQYKPTVRTYTHRAYDTLTGAITIDFVDHGENGPASSWAIQATVGSQLGVAMKLRPTVHYPTADWYFLIGDATAIPVLTCIMESLPAHAKGHCVIEVHGAEDIHPEVNHPGFEIDWIFNEKPEKGSLLAPYAKQIPIPKVGNPFAYIACEYQSVRNLRAYFKEELGWNNQQFYAFSYWKAGVAEDHSAQERRAEKS